MFDIVLKGVISVPNENKDSFVQDLNEFLNSKEAMFRGEIRTYEFDDAEIIEDEKVTD